MSKTGQNDESTSTRASAPASSVSSDASACSDTGDAATAETIGQRFNQRWAEELLEASFASAGLGADAPRSIGVVEVAALDGRPMTALLDELGPDVTLRIRQTLPRDARLVFAHGARFVMALPGDPLLEALLIVDRVRDALERETWQVDGESLELCFDAGVSTRHGPDEPLSVTLAAAERSLMQAHRLAIHHHDGPVESETPESAPRPISAAWSRAFHGKT